VSAIKELEEGASDEQGLKEGWGEISYREANVVVVGVTKCDRYTEAN